MKARKTAGILIFALSVMVTVVTIMRDTTTPDHTAYIAANDNTPRLSAARVNHILYGDRTGGGHKFGTGAPCKSEFPASWSDDDIIAAVKTLAANDNARWKQEDNGYHTAVQTATDGTRVRVVLDRERDDVITAYPVNRPRNPCPAGN